ncbi:TIR domain-containing adapter molecule 2 [Protopterus annectens]|uniref:TIR domain-containing adapter molecule 2 n=1 Tax=Protopterus annectens TaxID=7888 RepID=UPI001CF9EFD4|nr:TIR domain-containing adapter molecule 2 [Protopterus annectens]
MGNKNSSTKSLHKTKRAPLAQNGKPESISTSKLNEGHVESRVVDSEIEEIVDEGLDLNKTFYKFVILHAESDVEEAVRVRNLLEIKFNLKPGIVLAELPSGRHLFDNLSDALNGSAWTVILLTTNFLKETLCEYQSYITLIDSITNQHKSYSVIPIRPSRNPLPRERTPFALQVINALEERSPAFDKQVKKTFQESFYIKQKELWLTKRTNLYQNTSNS